MLAIQIHDDEGGVTSVQLPDGTITIGRGEDCDVRLLDRNVSRLHVRFVRQDAKAWVEDAGARFGTYVNGERLDEGERVAVGPGDVVSVGYYSIDVVIGDATAHVDTEEVPAATTVPESGVLELESEVRDDLAAAPAPPTATATAAADDDDEPPPPPLEPAAPAPPTTATEDEDEEPPPPPLAPAPKPKPKPKPAPAETTPAAAAAGEPDDFLLYEDDLDAGQRSSSMSSFVVLVVVLLLGAALVYAYFKFFRPDAAVESTRLPGDPSDPAGVLLPDPGAAPGPLVVRSGDRTLPSAAWTPSFDADGPSRT